jgi:2-dehydro-3-deoxy-D-gluconate 5-dehydrogenase
MILDRFRLDGKVAIVTGASRGIGKAMAQALAEAGADVVVAARSEKPLRELAEELEAMGQRALAFPLDIAKEDDLKRLVETVVREFGRIDILVNNAGINYRCPAENFPIEEYDRVLNVNLRSVFILCQLAGRQMIAQGGGKIINTASLMSETGGIMISAYTASKGGIKQLTKTLALEWGPYNIQVNAIGPGYIRTEMTQPLRDDPERNRMILERVCIKRWGEPEDLQGMTVFLASSASDYVTGQVFYVDGGYLAR